MQQNIVLVLVVGSVVSGVFGLACVTFGVMLWRALGNKKGGHKQ